MSTSAKFDRDWETIVIRVGDRYFYAPKDRLVNARTYTDKDNIFTGKLDEKDQKGQDAKHAIILENVLESDFERFLSFLYPTLAEAHVGVAVSEWLVVLKLSTLWYFKDMRKLAIEALDVISPSKGGLNTIGRIFWGRLCHIPSCFEEGLVKTAQRCYLITMAMAQTIGLETAFKLYQIRNRDTSASARKSVDPASGFSTSSGHISAKEDVLLVFRDEIQVVKECSAGYGDDPTVWEREKTEKIPVGTETPNRLPKRKEKSIEELPNSSELPSSDESTPPPNKIVRRKH